jgi:signal transduction histidine kinase
LNNIIKHSEASEADIQVFFDNYDESITLMVSDNGKGIPDEFIKNPNGGMGLSNLHKRVNYLKGQLHFDVNKNGTTVIVTVPFEKVDI